VSETLPNFFDRLSLALRAFSRLLADARFAARVAQLPEHEPSAPTVSVESIKPSAAAVVEPPTERDFGAALQLLATLQREGRLIDFIQQDVTGFSDAEVGAAARVVHQGCRRALEQTTGIEPIRVEVEGSTLTLDPGFDPKAHRLLGNVQGQPPYRGTLRHRGWKATRITLEEPMPTADLTILGAAEVEL